jgi:transcriptional regulator with PAS, ATPase and Fis domain
MPQLIVCRKGGNYRVIPFTESLRIGRDEDNDLILDSPQVSRHHGTVLAGDNGFYLTDCGSTNAIWNGNEKITSILLANGFTFRIVDFFLTFVDEQHDRPDRVFSGKKEYADPEFSEPAENKTILFGLESFLPEPEQDKTAEKGTISDCQLTDLLNSLHRLGAVDNKSELYSLLLRTSMKMLSGKCGFIAAHDEAGELLFRAMENMATREKARICYDLVNQVVTTGVTVLNTVAADSPAASNKRNRKSSGIIFCSPLPGENKVDGCLYIESSAPLPATEAKIVQTKILLSHGAALLERLRCRIRNNQEKQELKNRLILRDETIIHSEIMLRLYEDIRTIAPINVPVLILGEAGTGKELVASALHSFSKRQGAYIPLNCSAIPEGIFESELFGSVKGAFHNAVDKPGKLEMAHNGTIFLDEIGDMGLALQPKLLRFLENNQITRLGDTRFKKLDVRIVAATNQNLDEMMEQKKFREDFFQRLSCFILNVPPLRERKEDIEPLIHYFLKQFANEYKWLVPTIAAPVYQALSEYSWPGNIRELKNTLLRLSVQARGNTITMDDLARISDTFGEEAFQKVASFPSMVEMEKKYIRKALDRAGWNISDAARMVGIARSTFYQKMKKFQIKAEN